MMASITSRSASVAARMCIGTPLETSAVTIPPSAQEDEPAATAGSCRTDRVRHVAQDRVELRQPRGRLHALCDDRHCLLSCVCRARRCVADLSGDGRYRRAYTM